MKIFPLILYMLIAAIAGAETFIIDSERFDISGRTREAALTDRIGSSLGRTFEGKDALEAYVTDRSQKLENLRIFKSSRITIEYPPSPPAENPGSPVPVALLVSIEDGRPVSPIPYAFYNSNAGLQTGLLVSLPNVAGRMQNLMLVGLYGVPPDDGGNLRWTNPNFVLLGVWDGIPLGPASLSVAGSARKSEKDVVDRGVTGLTYTETGFSGTLGVTLPVTGELSDTVSVKAGKNVKTGITDVLDRDLLAYGPNKAEYILKDELSLKNVDWIGNFRSGWQAKAGVSLIRKEPAYADRLTYATGDAEIAGYLPLGNHFNPSFRTYAFATTGKAELEAAEHERGIRDNGMKGTRAVFINTGVQTKLFRAGQAELHLTPLLDFGWAYAPGAKDYENDWGFGTGAEVLLIFDSMKTLPIKLGFAWDLRPQDRLGDNERYEVDFNFSFTY